MSQVRRVQRTGRLCSAVSEQFQIEACTAFGSPDLKGRPSPMVGRLLFTEVEECAGCGYCNRRIDDPSPGTAGLGDADAYRAILTFEQRYRLANRFLARACLKEAGGRIRRAFHSTLRAVTEFGARSPPRLRFLLERVEKRDPQPYPGYMAERG